MRVTLTVHIGFLWTICMRMTAVHLFDRSRPQERSLYLVVLPFPCDGASFAVSIPDLLWKTTGHAW
jgi:hypothetical protein